MLPLILKILFVGNSLTYYNDLPSLVAEIAKEDGVKITYTHPSIHGSVLAAMVIYTSINGKKDLDFLKTSKWKEISDAQLEIMKEAAIASLSH